MFENDEAQCIRKINSTSWENRTTENLELA